MTEGAFPNPLCRVAPWAPEVQVAGRSGGEGSAGPGEVSGANEETARMDAPASSGAGDERAGRRLSDDCWAGPQGLAKKEESAVQQLRRKVPPFSDVSPVACNFRQRGLPERAKGRPSGALGKRETAARGKVPPPSPREAEIDAARGETASQRPGQGGKRRAAKKVKKVVAFQGGEPSNG